MANYKFMYRNRNMDLKHTCANCYNSVVCKNRFKSPEKECEVCQKEYKIYRFKLMCGIKGFKYSINNNTIKLMALDKNNKYVDWITYNFENNKVGCNGDATYLNLDLKNLDTSKVLVLCNDLNNILELEEHDKFTFKDLMG